MERRQFFLMAAAGAGFALALQGGDAKDKDRIWTARGSNKVLEMQAKLIPREDIPEVLGGDPGASLVVVEVTVRTLEDTKYDISPDDFLMVSARDGQKAEPFSPEQLASSSILVVRQQSTKGGVGVQQQSRFPGGLGGSPGGVGTYGTSPTSVSTETRTQKDENPMLKKLRDKQLGKEASLAGTKGLLYFAIEGKYKPKDIAVIYRGREGRITMDFGEKK